MTPMIFCTSLSVALVVLMLRRVEMHRWWYVTIGARCFYGYLRPDAKYLVTSTILALHHCFNSTFINLSFITIIYTRAKRERNS